MIRALRGKLAPIVDSGSVLAGKYRLESLLGRGGMGSVWRATHLGLEAPVAIKLIDPHVMSNPEAIGRFHREARAAAGLRSPHVVQILDHGVDEATHVPFIAMELMEGESLAQRLARLGRLSPAETARVITHVSRALVRAHEGGVVHRDLKPDNVFLVQNEDEELAKVLDFGIAKAQSALATDSATRTGAVMGTPYYMSPEQISGAKNVDFRTDLWALGVMTVECLTGRRPFDADSIGGLTLKICVEPVPPPSTFGPVPPGFDAWFERAVARDVNRRFGSAREAAEELRRVCAGEGGVGRGSAPMLGYAPAPTPAQTSPSRSAGPGTGPSGVATASPIQYAGAPTPTTAGQAAAASLSALSRTSAEGALTRAGSGRRSGPWIAVTGLAAVVVGGAVALFLFGRDAPTDEPAASAAALVPTPAEPGLAPAAVAVVPAPAATAEPSVRAAASAIAITPMPEPPSPPKPAPLPPPATRRPPSSPRVTPTAAAPKPAVAAPKAAVAQAAPAAPKPAAPVAKPPDERSILDQRR